MADKPKNGDINTEYNVASTGINLDNSQNNIKKGSLSYALNAALENYDANTTQYQNEPGNEACFVFPDGYKLIGKHFIPEQNKIIFLITDSELGESEIGYMVNNDCVYRTLVNDPCLNFKLDKPVLSMVHKVTNFGTELYWADNNGRRYLDIDNIPYIKTGSSDICDPEDSPHLDCNKLLLQPDINIPIINVDNVISGGETRAGTYQFTVQYADAVGNPYTSFYSVTNPTPIADVQNVTVNFNAQVGKSIIVGVENLNPLGQYQYFNLVVIKTINGTSTPELVGTYFIDNSYKKITYTGQIQTNITLTMDEVFEKFSYYDNADYVTAVADVLVWKGMTAVERINYQKIANKISLKWQSYRMPASESYATEANASKYRGYLRDEVYAFEVVFLLTNGKETDAFHIPGRARGQFELTAADVDQSNPDFIGTPDEGTTTTPYWKVYNTASTTSTDDNYDPTNDDYKGPYQSGEFAYWESTEEYPCDEEIWGELANKKVRHHKFPDVLVSPIIESTEYTNAELVMEDVATFPIGVKIDSEQVEYIIENSELTESQRKEIIGYKITRADRGVNKSIIAKGMLRNVGAYKKDDKDFFYPNYPYNDVGEDPFVNGINNAWTEQCEEYTIEIFNLPLQDDGERWVEVEYKSCNNNKADAQKWTDIGIKKVCSIIKPTFSSKGNHNKMNHGSGGSFPKSDCDAIVYPSNYDVWEIGWRVDQAAGYTAEWNDIVEGLITTWLCCPFGGPSTGPTLKVRLPIGEKPDCAGACTKKTKKYKPKYTPLNEVRVEACKEDKPLAIENQDELTKRQIFNSPETSFGQPFLGNILKLESVMYGAGKAHFVPVRDNAKYKLLTEQAQRDALLAAEIVADKTSTFSLESMFSVYNAYITTYVNGITRKNYAYSFNSIANYNYAEPIPNDFGVKQRNIDIKKFITPDILSVGEENGEILNNYNRETSVFLRTLGDTTLPFPHKSPEMLPLGIKEKSRFTISSIGNCASPEKEEPIKVISYYGSLKNEFVNQYGQIYSYKSVDTGFVKIFGKESLNEDVIFGGDTFIGKFAYKTKVPFFFDDRVNAPNDSDIFYDEIGNIAYPRYWHSSRSILKTYQGIKTSLRFPNFLSYKAHNFDCPNEQGPIEIAPGDDPENYPDRTYYDGYYYLYAYGVPSFYCESSYNLDLRTAFNNKEGEFWPHVSTGIPDEWFQQTNVSILNDNTYNYNSTFSKQNRESVITHIPTDWGTGEDRIKYPFRAVYSDRQITDADNRVNNWLTYRPISYFDFPQNYGALTALDGLKNSSILARFENKSLLYNSLLTIDASNERAVYIGNDKLFTNAPPQDFAETDQGYIGSQHKMLLKTPNGAVSIDAKRGQIFLLNGAQLQDLTQFGSGMHRWFTAHLPFEIIKHFPDVDIDNNFNGIGLHGVFDSNYERVILTKIDYIPLSKNITHENGKYYINEKDIKREIYLIDSDYFCSVSWTISFNFNSNSWVSFHSYIPNWYVGENNFFYSGLNYCPNDFDVLVAVVDTTPYTTTSTTTTPPTTTTTTTIPEFIPNCDFDGVFYIPACELTGGGIYIGEPYIPPCKRPVSVEADVSLITGFTLITPSSTVDSTVSKEAACGSLEYYSLFGVGDLNYTPIYIKADIEGYLVGNTLYDSDTYPDCATIPDGWYFSDETSTSNKVFEVIDGIITQVAECGVENTTTTTTTTLLPNYQICYTGIWTEPDPIHPLGGVVQYYDEFGDYQVISNIWSGAIIDITVSEIEATTGVVLCGI